MKFYRQKSSRILVVKKFLSMSLARVSAYLPEIVDWNLIDRTGMRQIARQARPSRVSGCGKTADARAKAGSREVRGIKHRRDCVVPKRDAGRSPKTFYLETFGCQMNAHDSEKVVGTLLSAGISPGSDRRRGWAGPLQHLLDSRQGRAESLQPAG